MEALKDNTRGADRDQMIGSNTTSVRRMRGGKRLWARERDPDRLPREESPSLESRSRHRWAGDTAENVAASLGADRTLVNPPTAFGSLFHCHDVQGRDA